MFRRPVKCRASGFVGPKGAEPTPFLPYLRADLGSAGQLIVPSASYALRPRYNVVPITSGSPKVSRLHCGEQIRGEAAAASRDSGGVVGADGRPTHVQMAAGDDELRDGVASWPTRRRTPGLSWATFAAEIFVSNGLLPVFAASKRGRAHAHPASTMATVATTNARRIFAPPRTVRQWFHRLEPSVHGGETDPHVVLLRCTIVALLATVNASDAMGGAMAREIEVAPAAELVPGVVRGAGRYAVGNANGELFAVTRRCRHFRADLANGSIDEEGCLVCPWHGAKYDVASGRMTRGPQGFFAKIPRLDAGYLLLTKVLPLRRGRTRRAGRHRVRPLKAGT